MKLEVGMYVRTDLGEIGKVTSVLDDDSKAFGLSGQFYNSEPFLKGTEIKVSHNIIDLIEVGDVVVDNSGRKLEVNLIRVWDDVKEIICNDYNLDDSALILHNDGIFKILTHEQFEIKCFRIGDE